MVPGKYLHLALIGRRAEAIERRICHSLVVNRYLSSFNPSVSALKILV